MGLGVVDVCDGCLCGCALAVEEGDEVDGLDAFDLEGVEGFVAGEREVVAWVWDWREGWVYVDAVVGWHWFVWCGWGVVIGWGGVELAR